MRQQTSSVPMPDDEDALREDRGANHVSIHAPMGGATGGAVGETRDVVVSIHAPVGGATVFLLSFCIHAACIGLFANCCRSIVITTISLALFSYNMLTFNLRDLVYFSCNATHSLNYMINSASTL